MKAPTLIIFSPGFAENEGDTTCIPALQQFVLEMKKLRPDIKLKVFSLHYPFSSGNYRWNGVECYSFGGKNRGGIYGLFLRRKVKKHLASLIQHNDVLALLSIWMLDCALIAEELGREFGLRHFCWMHGQDALVGNRHVKNIRPQPEQIIAISDLLQKEFAKNYGIKAAHIIENGITEELFPKFNASERVIDIIGVGSLIPLKNYSGFVDVVSELKKQFPNINAVIVGDGPDREMIHQKISAMELDSNIILTGSIPHQEVLKLMSQSKILLHTSTYEGSSGVIMEALYSGCFVVTNFSISLRAVKNVQIATNINEMIRDIALILENKELKQERVIYNTMKHSAQKIISLLGV